MSKQSDVFDVFLSHNSKDKPAVRQLYEKLQSSYGLRVWYDEEELPPGLPWQLLLEKGIRNSAAVGLAIWSIPYFFLPKSGLNDAGEAVVNPDWRASDWQTYYSDEFKDNYARLTESGTAEDERAVELQRSVYQYVKQVEPRGVAPNVRIVVAYYSLCLLNIRSGGCQRQRTDFILGITQHCCRYVGDIETGERRGSRYVFAQPNCTRYRYIIAAYQSSLGGAMRRNKIFISYSHNDKALLEEFQTHLGYWGDEGQIQIWCDRGTCRSASAGNRK